MKNRLLSLLLSVTLVLSAVPAALAGYENFTSTASYAGQFTDVPASEWYAANVQAAYELGLINGKSATQFDPDGSLTLAEAVKLAAVLHSVYVSGQSSFAVSTPWYQTYVDYAKANGILSVDYADYEAVATRAQFATLLGAALPEEAFPVINDVEDGAIPDVSTGGLYSTAVYKLYRAGVLTGSNGGYFRPSESIKRREVAAIVTRMADPSLRLSVTLLKETQTALTSEQIFAQCSPAVFYIEVYNAGGTALASGSGVFLSSTGEAMTNYHVIEGASSARVRTTDGAIYTVSGVYAADADRDLARIQVEGSGFSYLTTSETLTTGAVCYAIGSPLGLENTISNGIISAASRTVNGQEYIQTTASISHGSSGGALIDTNGRLIGITSAYIDGGQNLNLAIPVKDFVSLGKGTLQALSAVTGTQASASTGVTTYTDYDPVPDFGAYSGASVYDKQTNQNGMLVYSYRASEITRGSTSAVLNSYFDLLVQSGFTYYGRESSGGMTQYTYANESQGVAVVIGTAVLYGEVFVMVGLDNI